MTEALPVPPPHITVCVCTYERADLLERLIAALCGQQTDGLFTFSVAIVDNDCARSAEPVVSKAAARSSVPVRYCVEPRQGIALARNRALEEAGGEFVAFIDDDELPPDGWLANLFQACVRYQAAGVLGPVRPRFERGAPDWIVKGRFYERPAHPTGLVLGWPQCRTGNVLMKRNVIAGMRQPFRPELVAGEDQDFFRRMISRGHVFVWCEEAAVLESVPPARWKRRFLLRRALLRGVSSWWNRPSPLVPLLHSLLAVPVYVAVLPLLFLFGEGRGMKGAFSMTYHLGRICGSAGILKFRKYTAD